MRIYGYLRASTKEQDVHRAKDDLTTFAKNQGHTISAWFFENESGATLKRPELFRLLEIAQKDDLLLVEQIDRISRLNTDDWNKLKSMISDKGIRIVAFDLPTSHQFMQSTDEFTQRMLSAINAMMLDMLAAVARKDYEDRRRRQRQGIDRAKADKKYKGRPVNQRLRDNISALLRDGKTWSDISNILSCSRATIAKVNRLQQT